MASSGSRAAPRASSRFATFSEAMSSTTATIARMMASGVANGRRTLIEALRAGRQANREISRRRLGLTRSGGRLWFSGLRLLVEGRELRLGLCNLDARRQAAHYTGEERHPTAGEQLPIRERS